MALVFHRHPRAEDGRICWAVGRVEVNDPASSLILKDSGYPAGSLILKDARYSVPIICLINALVDQLRADHD